MIKSVIKNILGDEFFFNNIKEIRCSVVGCETFLDLGCGSESPYLKYIHEDCHKATGVDLYAKVKPGYDEIVRKDILEFIRDVPDKFYDAVLGFDIVEHFDKKDSITLINEMQRVAAKVVVIVTPNGFWPGMLTGHGQDHLCGVSHKEFEDAGFKVWGGRRNELF